jgi:hypothetical protein
MNSFRQPKLCDPGVALGVISGFPVHGNYPVEDREKLDKFFREDYFAWEAMSKAAISRFATNRSNAEAPVGPSPFSHYRVNGWWEWRRIVDNGFILFGSSDALHDFMKGHNLPYILKTETQRETVSLFSDQGSEVDSVYVGDLEDSCEIISRVYSFLRPGAIFGTYTVAEFAGSFSHSWIDVLGNFVRHIRQNGEVTPAWQDSIVINDERARREIKLLDHPRLKDCAMTNRPTFGSVLGLIMAGPKPPPQLIDASETCNHLRKHLRVRGTVTEIAVNRRGDVVLRFGSRQADFKAVIPASCVLSKEQEWIDSLKN